MAEFDVLNPLANIYLMLTEDQLTIINEWFEENSKPLLIINEGEPTNIITVDMFVKFLELKKFHRRSFHYPSYAEIMTNAEKLKVGVTKILTKDQFIYMLNKWVLEPDLKHELILAFKIFDTEKRNFLEINEIEAIVTKYGDLYDEGETLEILRDANVRGDGNVFYEDFVDSMFSLAPELKEVKATYLYDDPDEDPSVPPEPIIVVEDPPQEHIVEAVIKLAKPSSKSKGKGKK